MQPTLFELSLDVSWKVVSTPKNPVVYSQDSSVFDAPECGERGLGEVDRGERFCVLRWPNIDERQVQLAAGFPAGNLNCNLPRQSRERASFGIEILAAGHRQGAAK